MEPGPKRRRAAAIRAELERPNQGQPGVPALLGKGSPFDRRRRAASWPRAHRHTKRSVCPAAAAPGVPTKGERAAAVVTESWESLRLRAEELKTWRR